MKKHLHTPTKSELYQLEDAQGTLKQVTIHYGSFSSGDFPYSYQFKGRGHKEQLFPNATLPYLMQERRMHPEKYDDSAIVLALMNSASRNKNTHKDALVTGTHQENHRAWASAAKLELP